MQVKAVLQIFLFLIITSHISYSQVFSINNDNRVTEMPGDEIKAEWSYDSKQLLFQHNYENRNGLYLYLVESDTVITLKESNDNYSNPVWHPDGDKVVFDSDNEGVVYLYVLDLITNKITPLFTRKIECRNASFSTSSRQVYFTGYDELHNSWEIYSYDFVYDNLNRLTNYKLGNSDPDISTDGKQVVYCKENAFKRTKNVEVINWYGEKVISFNDFNGQYPSWSPSGLKLFFVSDMNNVLGDVYSIWKDGTHLERLTNNDLKVAFPVISPDETKIAMSVLTETGWDIYVFNFDDIGF